MDKQALLKRHRRKKRLTLAGLLLLALLLGTLISWYWPLLLGLVAWIAHEAWFADHLFYPARQDYAYRLQGGQEIPLSVQQEALLAASPLPADGTWILEVSVQSTWAGRFLDPYMEIGGQRFDFERGAGGKRYLNLSPQATDRLPYRTHRCHLQGEARLTLFHHPDFTRQRLLVIAPHADDAELAAFHFYRQCAEVLIVTLTQGEVEAENYTELGLSLAEAARLKGRLRSWDSIAVPLWGGLAQENCLQLGYFCMQLAAMQAQPEVAFASRQAQENDTRRVRGWNRQPLPSDQDGQATWHNLLADLRHLLESFRPEVILTPHPRLDPHPDHVAATQAIREATRQSQWQPATFLLYANHLHDNDRWPMGPAGGGIGLAPAFDTQDAESFWSLPLSPAAQLDKAMALAMQHDLAPRLPFKKRLRRWLQSVLAGRRWPRTGENEYFRKAVRSHELFHVRPATAFCQSASTTDAAR